MNLSNNTRPIVVAVDGSDSALRAARWAAAQARRRGQGLRIVHTYEWPPVYGLAFTEPATMHDAVSASAADIVREAVSAVSDVDPELRPETETVRGAPISVLREVSKQASLLVLGSRGLGGFTGLLAGSVAVALAAHGHCPVAVIRGGEPQPDGAVILGVDGSPASDAAIPLAFEEAAARGCELVAVHAWTDTVFPVTPAGSFYPELDWVSLAERAAATLTERLAGWQDKYPGVTVRHVVERDRPASALLEAAKSAQLLVVGSRGRGGFAGLTLGSVSQAMIHHAPCPVLIARPDAS
jgi:nucleotide-binding universal stress UspA family protein